MSHQALKHYALLRKLGDGTFGCVYLGKHHVSGDMVAVKLMKREYRTWDECVNLREVKSLIKLKHPNIVRLIELLREDNKLYFVFEYMKENLYEMTKNRTTHFPEATVRNIAYQILQGLAFMHKHGFFHRDLKPENLLCTGEVVKIADFGLAREIRSRPPYTEYVSTRWYRAPELCLHSTTYNSPIDMWAVGCIIAEVYNLRPLFPGKSEADQFHRICSILGSLDKTIWSDGVQLAVKAHYKIPLFVRTGFSNNLIKGASADGVEVISQLLQWDPKKRPTAAQALRFKFFRVGEALTTASQPTASAHPSQPVAPTQPAYNFRKQQPSKTELATKIDKPTTPGDVETLSMISAGIENVQGKVLGRSKLEQHARGPTTTHKQSPVHVLPPIGAGEMTGTHKRTSFNPAFKSKGSIGRRGTYENMVLDKSANQRRGILSGALRSKSDQVDKAEAAQFYMSRARYSPLSGGGSGRGNSGQGVGFGSSAPRWSQQQSRELAHPPHPPVHHTTRLPSIDVDKKSLSSKYEPWKKSNSSGPRRDEGSWKPPLPPLAQRTSNNAISGGSYHSSVASGHRRGGIHGRTDWSSKYGVSRNYY